MRSWFKQLLVGGEVLHDDPNNSCEGDCYSVKAQEN